MDHNILNNKILIEDQLGIMLSEDKNDTIEEIELKEYDNLNYDKKNIIEENHNDKNDALQNSYSLQSIQSGYNKISSDVYAEINKDQLPVDLKGKNKIKGYKHPIYILISYLIDVISVQNCFLFSWIIYFMLQSLSGFLNFECFLGNSRQSDAIASSLQNGRGWNSDWFVTLINLSKSIIEMFIAIFLVSVLISRGLRWLSLPKSGRFEDHFIRTIIESVILSIVLLYFSFSCMINLFIIGNRERMIEMFQHYFTVLVGIVFFFPQGHKFAYYINPIHWCAYMIFQTIDAIPIVGIELERKFFRNSIGDQCFNDIYFIFFYLSKLIYAHLALFYLGAIVFFIIKALTRKNSLKQFANRIIFFIYKISIIIFTVLMAFFQIIGDQKNASNSRYNIMMLIVSAALCLSSKERENASIVNRFGFLKRKVNPIQESIINSSNSNESQSINKINETNLEIVETIIENENVSNINFDNSINLDKYYERNLMEEKNRHYELNLE